MQAEQRCDRASEEDNKQEASKKNYESIERYQR